MFILNSYNNLSLGMLSTVKVLLIFSVLVCSTLAVPSLKCLSYLLELNSLYDINKGLCKIECYISFKGNSSLYDFCRQTGQ